MPLPLQYLSFTPPSGASQKNFTAISVDGEEELSTPYVYRIRAVCDDTAVDFANVVGKTATVTMALDATPTNKYLSGYITHARLVQIDRAQSNAIYEMEMRPFLWLLNYHSDCRVFQAKTVPDLVIALLKELGYTDVTNSTIKTYTARDYCVQYNETTFNFINRLFEEEGIFYFFTFTSGVHTMVLADDSSKFTACSTSAITFHGSASNTMRDDYTLTEVELAQRVGPAGYSLNSYEFTTPATNLYSTSTATTTNNAALVMNEYKPVFSTTTVGEAIAKLRLEAYEAEGSIIRGEVRAPSFQVGNTFTMSGHPRSALNATFVLAKCKFNATQSDMGHTFDAFLSTVPFRPKKRAEKPRIYSTLTATVVGKAGEEIWTDSYGRVVIQFPWDRLGKSDENSSIWVRVSQGWAGKAWGSLTVPRIGTEVLVTFIDGDPDKPIVTGTVYNATQTMPYTYPADQTKSTFKTNSSKGGGKFNELRFEDKAGSEEVYIEAAKDMTETITNDVTKTVGHDEKVTITNDNTITVNHDRTITVKNNDTRTVSDGNDSLTVSTGTRSVTIKGDETHTNSGNFTHEVDGDYKLTVKGAMTITVTGDLTIKAKDVDVESSSGTVTLKSATSFTLQSGTALTIKSGTDATVQSGTNMTVQGGVNLDVKAAAQLNVQGAMTSVKASGMGTVDGGGMLTVKGGIVQIN